MAIGANSYGSAVGIAAFVPNYASTGTFTTGTRPTLAQVEGWIDSVSGILNSILAEAGFTIPISNTVAPDVVGALNLFVNEEVASFCEGVNGSGRFGPTSKAVGKQGRFSLMLEDVKAFVESNKAGFERLGAERAYDVTSSIAYRDTDESGEAVAPFFERKAFGDTTREWDS